MTEMKFCWHDWYIHQKGNKSRTAAIFGSNVGGMASAITLMVTMFIGGMALGPLIGTEAIIVAVILGATFFVVALVESCVLYVGDYDPHRQDDRTCLKCDKIEFNHSKQEKRNIPRKLKIKIKKEKLSAIAIERDKKADQARSSFKEYKKLWDKANLDWSGDLMRQWEGRRRGGI